MIAHVVMQAGSVAFFTRATAAPDGWLKANGAAVSRSAYGALFAEIGTLFGVGDGATTFNLPDVRGEFLRCLDDGRGVDAARVMGSAQGHSFASHAHTWGVNDKLSAGAGAGAPGFGSGADSTSAVGGTETRPRNMAFLACIKY